MTSRRRDIVSNQSPESRQGPQAAADRSEIVSVLLPLPLGDPEKSGLTGEVTGSRTDHDIDIK